MSAGVVGRSLKVPTLSVGARTQFQTFAQASFSAPGSVAYAAGAWTQLTASTSSRLLLAQVAAVSSCSYTGTDDPGAAWQMVAEFGVGGSGSEVVAAAVATGAVFAGSTSDLPSGDSANAGLLPMVDVPAGSRLAVRVQLQTRLAAGRSVVGSCDATVWLIDPLAVL